VATTVRVLGLLVLGELALTWIFHGFLFHPRCDENPSVEHVGGARVRYRTDDGLTLVGWWVPAQGAPRRTVVYFHGNAATASDCWGWADALARRGADVLLAEYRGYGQSKGRPSARGIERDADAAIRYLLDERHVQPRALVVHGQSLGGAAAVVALSGRARGAAGGILESTFTSLHDMSRAVFGLPLTLLVYDAYGLDSEAHASAIRARVLHVHGDRDEVVPYALGEALQAELPTARFLRVRGGTHNVRDPGANEAMLDFIDDVAP
jgi:fermentation-respiration switch protein FrsA (DUF1100 family)